MIDVLLMTASVIDCLTSFFDGEWVIVRKPRGCAVTDGVFLFLSIKLTD